MKPIARHTGVTPLSWHRLRHTWAERMAELLAEQANGMDKLMYLGGWITRNHPSDTSRTRLPDRRERRCETTIAASTERNRRLMAPALRSAHDLAYTVDLPPVPARVRSLDGQLVETAKDCWTMHVSADGGRTITIRWERLRGVHQVLLHTTRGASGPAVSCGSAHQEEGLDDPQRLLHVPVFRSLAPNQRSCPSVQLD